MLINDESVNLCMPLRTALEQGSEATDSQVRDAVTHLKTGDAELAEWGRFEYGEFSKIKRHRENSQESVHFIRSFISEEYSRCLMILENSPDSMRIANILQR